MSEPAQGELCAAHGCPMLAAIGVAGRYWCCCHWHEPAAAFDAITAVLHRQKLLVDAALLARRSYADYLAVRSTEDALIERTHEVGQQYALKPTRGARGGVIGPTTEPAHHYASAESDNQ
ncbi:hypothetical protein QFZ94_007491 [Paraburkholderia sp. JPY465]|uniref:hypothetical protein n=1 Tax=Paraburkholderia sp. JPY465 TaxID=3042285 RepID=UPI003D23BB57